MAIAGINEKAGPLIARQIDCPRLLETDTEVKVDNILFRPANFGQGYHIDATDPEASGLHCTML